MNRTNRIRRLLPPATIALSTLLTAHYACGQSAYTCDEGKPFTAEKMHRSLNENVDKSQPNIQFGGMVARDSSGRIYGEWHVVGVKAPPHQTLETDRARVHLSVGTGPGIRSMAEISDCHTGKNIRIFPDLRTARIGYNVGASSWKRKDGASLFDFLTSGPRPANVILEDLGFKEIEGLLTHGYRETILGTEDGGDVNGAVLNITEWWVSDDLAEVVLQIITNPKAKTKSESGLINIRRGEPDPALFEIPEGYKIDATPDDKHPAEEMPETKSPA